MIRLRTEGSVNGPIEAGLAPSAASSWPGTLYAPDCAKLTLLERITVGLSASGKLLLARFVIVPFTIIGFRARCFSSLTLSTTLSKSCFCKRLANFFSSPLALQENASTEPLKTWSPLHKFVKNGIFHANFCISKYFIFGGGRLDKQTVEVTHKGKQRLYFRCNNYRNKAQLRAEASGHYRTKETVDLQQGRRVAWAISTRLAMRTALLFKQRPVLHTS